MDQFECDVVFLTLIRLQDEYGSRFRRSPLQIRTAMKQSMEFVATNGVVTALDHVQEFMGTNSTMQFLQSTTGSQQTIAGYHHQTDTKRTEAFDDVGLLARMQQSHSAASILLFMLQFVGPPGLSQAQWSIILSVVASSYHLIRVWHGSRRLEEDSHRTAGNNGNNGRGTMGDGNDEEGQNPFSRLGQRVSRTRRQQWERGGGETAEEGQQHHHSPFSLLARRRTRMNE